MTIISNEGPRDGGSEATLRDRIGVRVDEPVIVLGGYGVRNVGDEAILAGLLSRIGRQRVSVVSRNPQETSAMHRVRAIPVRSAVTEMRRHRALLIGGGGLFSRHMGLLGRMIPAYGLLASAMGLKVSMEGVGIDSQLPASANRLVARLARSCRSVRVRDRQSRDLLAAMGVEAEITADLSTFMQPSSAPAEFLSHLEPDRGRPIVGICLNAVSEKRTEPLLRSLPPIIEGMPEIQFCFIPMSQHPAAAKQNDLRLARQLASEAPSLWVLEGWHHPSAVLGMFSHLSAAVCMRFHSLLFARRMGIDLIACPYAEKCERWLDESSIRPVDTPEGLHQRLTQLLARSR